MPLQKREKTLLAAAGGTIVLAGLIAFVATGDSRSDDFLREERGRLQVEVQKKDKEMKAADEDAWQLVQWRKRSLPREPAVAQSRYREWLLKLCNQSGLGNLDITDNPPDPHRSASSHQLIYTRIPFVIRANGSLDQLVTFLHGFYSAGHLQLMRRLEIKPNLDDASEFDLQFFIDAVAMQNGAPTEKLSAEAGRELPGLTAYRQTVVARNFFAAFKETPPPVSSPPLDLARCVVVTGITQDHDDGTWQVWLTDRTVFQNLRLAEGEKFTVRAGSGQVRSIVPGDKVILQFNGKLCELELGENLAGGKQL